MPRPPPYDVVLLRRRMSGLWLTIPLLALGLCCLVLAFFGNTWGLAVGFVCTWVGSVSTYRQARLRRTSTRYSGSLTVSASAVVLDGDILVLRRSLRAARLSSTREGLLVRLERAWPSAPIELAVLDEENGRALLRELGFDASPATATFRLASPASFGGTSETLGTALLVAAMIGGAALVTSMGPRGFGSLVPWAMAVMALVGWVVLAFLPRSLVVGADGIFVHWLWRKNFFRYADVRDVGQDGADGVGASILVALRNEPAVRLPVRSRFTEGSTDEEKARIVARIKEALALFRDRPPAGEIRLPDRGKRPVAEWIRALRSSGSAGAADHRTAPVAIEELWRIAEDPAAEQVSRAGAAVALAAGLDAAGKARLRIAAVATAAPELREVLEASAAEHDEDRLSRALSRLTRK